MCMIDTADGLSIALHEEHRTARKEHRCTECRRMIQPGEQYLNEGTLFEGRIDTFKTCSHCQVVRQWLTKECGGWCYSGLPEDIQAHAQDGWYGKGVAMLAAGISRQWTKRNGELWRIPSLPKTTHERTTPGGP